MEAIVNYRTLLVYIFQESEFNRAVENLLKVKNFAMAMIYLLLKQMQLICACYLIR